MKECTNDSNHKFCMHSADFTLFLLGTFDDSNAKMELLAAPRNVINLITLKETLEPMPAEIAVA